MTSRLRRAICSFCLLGAVSGCQLAERARTCGRLASALEVPKPPHPHTSQASELLRAADEFTATAERLASVGPLPPKLDAIAKAAEQALTSQAQLMQAAAQAREASQPAEYADARVRADQTRRVLLDLKDRFDKLCAR